MPFTVDAELGDGHMVWRELHVTVMSMAGRESYAAELDGPGAPTLRSRLEAATA